MLARMRALWGVLARHRDYRFLLGAGLVSLAGDWVLTVGLTYHVYEVTGSTMASGTVLLAAFLPQVLLGSVAGVFVDRWDRRRTMIVANLLLAAGLLPLLAFDGAVRVWIAYIVVLFESCLEQFVTPAQASLVPHLVADGDLVSANALNGQNRNIARLAGSAVGAAAAAVGGVALVAVVDAATFVLAAGLLALIKARPAVLRAVHERVSLRSEWRAGLTLVRREPTLRALFVIAAITSVGEGIMGTLFVPYVRDVLHGNASAYGALNAAQAVGGIGAGFVAAVVAHRFAPRSLLAYGAALGGAVDLTMFLYPLAYAAVWPALVCMLTVGLPGSLVVVSQTTLFQRSSSDSHRGRVFGALGAVQGAAMLVGTVLAGTLGDVIGIVPVIAVQGVGYLVASVIVFGWLPRPAAACPSIVQAVAA
jgi:Na+/melibiose symporter-like transporter